MELEFKGQLQVYRHTLPYFMPVADIAERWLNDDMRHFVDEIGDMLNAFVSRRQQVNKLKVNIICCWGSISESYWAENTAWQFLC